MSLKLPFIIKTMLRQLRYANYLIPSNYESRRQSLKTLLRHLVSNADTITFDVLHKSKEGHLFYPNIDRLASVTGLNRWTVRHLLRLLQKNGFIARYYSPVKRVSLGPNADPRFVRDAAIIRFTDKFFATLKLQPKLLNDASKFYRERARNIQSKVGWMIQNKFIVPYRKKRVDFGSVISKFKALGAKLAAGEEIVPSKRIPPKKIIEFRQSVSNSILEGFKSGVIKSSAEFIKQLYEKATTEDAKNLILAAYPSVAN